jgi:pyocin large subunit-like protein
MRFTKAVPVFAATLALTACAATSGPRTTSAVAASPQAEAYAACETLLYRAPAPDKEAALTCAQRLDIWR